MSLDPVQIHESARQAREAAQARRTTAAEIPPPPPEVAPPRPTVIEAAPNPLDKLCYRPNEIPLKTRLGNSALSAAIIAYGTWGVHVNDLFIPAKRGHGFHLHALAAWIMYAAMLCAAAHLLSVVVDHYDHRDNEAHYSQFAEYARRAGWALCSLAVIVGLVLRQIN